MSKQATYPKKEAEEEDEGIDIREHVATINLKALLKTTVERLLLVPDTRKKLDEVKAKRNGQPVTLKLRFKWGKYLYLQLELAFQLI